MAGGSRKSRLRVTAGAYNGGHPPKSCDGPSHKVYLCAPEIYKIVFGAAGPSLQSDVSKVAHKHSKLCADRQALFLQR